MSEDQIRQLIREKYPTEGAAKIAALTGLSVDAVCSRAKRMGVRMSHAVRTSLTAATKKAKNSEMDTAIQERYSTEGPELLAEEFGRTKSYIMSRAFKLGVKKNRKPSTPKIQKPRAERQGRTKTKWTEEQIAEHREALKLGLKNGATKVGLRSGSAFLYRCKQMGLHEQIRGIPLPVEVQNIILSHNGKLSIRKLAREFGVTEDRIYQFYKKHGLTSTHMDLVVYHKENFRYYYFDTWSSEMAYWLGYIFADGSITRGGLRLLCKNTDAILVLTLRKLLKSKHSVRVKEVLHKSGRVGRRISCFVGSTRLSRSLQKLGVLIAKSKQNHDMPDVPEEYLADFVRGYFDGDGSVGFGIYGGKVKRWWYVLGQENFVKTFRERLRRALPLTEGRTPLPHYSAKVWEAGWGSLEDIKLLYDFLYPDDRFCLARKKRKFEQTIKDDASIHKGANPRQEARDFLERDVKGPKWSCLSDLPACQVGQDDSVVAGVFRFYREVYGFPYPIRHANADTLYRLRKHKGFVVDENTFVDGAGTGLKQVTLMYHRSFWETRAKGQLSPLDVFNDDLLLTQAILKCRQHEPNYGPQSMRNCIKLRTKSITNFSPVVARQIVDRWCPLGGTVYDPCMGWGSRLFATVCVGRRYIATDVNSEVVEGNNRLAFDLGVKVDLHNVGAESFDLPQVDLVFTSPPYFDVEEYDPNNPEQARMKYSTFDSFMSEWLGPCLDKWLSQSKMVILNVSQPMAEALKKTHGQYLTEEWRIKFASRPGKRKKHDRYEPLLVMSVEGKTNAKETADSDGQLRPYDQQEDDRLE